MGDFLMAGEPIYASPDGSGYAGTLQNPTSLTNALDSGLDFYLMDGIYTMDSVQIKTNVVIRAAEGARPVITHSNGKPPAVEMMAGSELHDIWLGGIRDEDQLTELHPGNNSIIDNCVFFNYVEGIGAGGAMGEIISHNKFINCGKGTLSHSIYINNAAEGHTAQVLENILIGGQAYHIHLFHDPINVDVRNNFSADADYCLVMQGVNHVFDGNILWKCSSPGYPVFLTSGSGRIYTNNYHGPITSASGRGGHPSWFGSPFPDDITPSGNYYYVDTQIDDSGGVITNDGDEVTLLGKSAAQIDSAISALESAFAQTVQQIHDDATIATNFATLKTVIDTWKAHS